MNPELRPKSLPQAGSVPIRYLGSKARLTGVVVDAIRREPASGPVVDLFAGMGHVSAGLAGDRSVIAVDASPSAATVLKWRLCSDPVDPKSILSNAQLYQEFASRLLILREAYAKVRTAEKMFLKTPTVAAADAVEEQFGKAPPGPSRCFDSGSLVTGYFSNAYFGVEQALQIDALLFALRHLTRRGSLSKAELLHSLVAILCACTHLTNGPGHFAQFFRVTARNAKVVAGMRSRAFLSQWEKELQKAVPAGDNDWRRGNRVIQADALDVEGHDDDKPLVKFADPPYTASQYSRFYHALDTIVLYDSPQCSYAGRYRHGRFYSEFCSKRGVLPAFRRLIKQSITRGHILFLTYPSNGLLLDAGVTVSDAAELSGGNATLIHETELIHASPGKAKSDRNLVIEELWRIHG